MLYFQEVSIGEVPSKCAYQIKRRAIKVTIVYYTLESEKSVVQREETTAELVQAEREK